MAKIWIPDEDNLLLTVIGRSLRRAGHSIVSCCSPQFAAVRPSAVNKGDNVLIVDLTTSENREMVLMLKIRIPRLKLLFLSERSARSGGWSGHGLVHAIAPAERQFLDKPFTTADLMTTLDDLLAGHTTEVKRAAGAA
jgi:DNA-binding NtrC family response regulator